MTGQQSARMMVAMDPGERADAEQQLAIFEFIAAAMARREEVFEIVFSSADPDDAQERLHQLLGGDDPEIGQAVLDLQVGRWTRRERENLAARTQRLRDVLNA